MEAKINNYAPSYCTREKGSKQCIEEHKFAVMENGPPTIGFEDGTIDVERLLVEPQDGHVSVDSVMCFNDIAENAMEMEEVSRRFGVEFAESITNLDYGSSEGLQTSVSDSPVLASAAVAETPWKADLFRAMEMPECQNHQLNADRSRFGEISDPCIKSETFVEEEQPSKSPASCALQDIGKFHDISSCSFQDILSDENDTSLSPSIDMLYSPKNEKSSEFGLTGQNGEIKRFQERDALVTSAPASHTNTFPTQKRSRKPTQRYIDELADPVSRHSKKRREVSSSKSLGVKDHKKCRLGPRAIRLPAEESSVKAIQVPFGSLVQNECPESCAYDMDKWRNLLKASGIQSQGSRQGEKKRNMAWRPLPKSILRRVCELATIYPYPKGRKTKIARIHHDSPDRSTDITLGDYRRILRSINGN
ncbi:UNVERIFIED_CONTAM: hypothetical protein Slati_3582600 [Sesamum latifolium]|uniref:Uncharacterized protein n=1 Tax=Sesamum latifolium TaxID=2727402 RepID=A0AAW2TYW9_9LAMI